MKSSNKKSSLQLLQSVVFLLALLLLLCNDFWWKAAYGNWWTGKLSDFAGLLVFAWFWSALLPISRKSIFIGTGILFVFWKTPYSQVCIDAWNALELFSISRVIDYSDYWAVLILPVSYWYLQHRQLSYLKISPVLPLSIAAFAFCATSYQKNFDYNKNYHFDCSNKTLVQRINILRDSMNMLPLSLNVNEVIDSMSVTDSVYIDALSQFSQLIPTPAEVYAPNSKTGYCEAVAAQIMVSTVEKGSTLTLRTMETANCMGMFEQEAFEREDANLLLAFEVEFIARLRAMD